MKTHYICHKQEGLPLPSKHQGMTHKAKNYGGKIHKFMKDRKYQTLKFKFLKFCHYKEFHRKLYLVLFRSRQNEPVSLWYMGPSCLSSTDLDLFMFVIKRTLLTTAATSSDTNLFSFPLWTTTPNDHC